MNKQNTRKIGGRGSMIPSGTPAVHTDKHGLPSGKGMTNVARISKTGSMVPSHGDGYPKSRDPRAAKSGTP